MPVAMLKTDVMKDAVRLACRAPSLYNRQPWRWVADREQLQLFLDPGRVTLADRSHREALIGCGAVLDHLRVAMAAAGWEAHVDRFPSLNEPNHLATITFTPMDHVTANHRRRANAILLRRTDRLPFKPPTRWQSFEPLLYSSTDGGTVHLDVMSDDVRPQLIEAYQIAESLRLYDSQYHTELGWWTAPFEVSEGIPYSCLPTAAESERVDVRRVFPVTHHSERRTEVPEDYAKVLVLSTDGDGRAEALASGEALSAVLLECTMAGLATCTLTYLTEVRVTRDLVAALLDYDCQPQVVVRVGVAPATEELPPLTPRRALNDVLRVRT
ncbi:MAG: NAD(P)H nitroreductase [Mycobacterium sp.]|nr:NAD(P)H nitroreductase [Mycobacterium sp.]